jgi:energy-coupling factor transporter ATP-binding protein EcfA2
MRLRGLVFERFGPFERAEVDLCDESGAPLDVVLFVGDAGAGKSALLRGVSGVLAEAAGAEAEIGEDDVRRTEENARCRVVFDDVVEGTRIVVTLEKELLASASPSAKAKAQAQAKPREPSLRASPPEAFERWKRAIEREAAPRAAFSIASTEIAENNDDSSMPASLAVPSSLNPRSSSPVSRADIIKKEEEEESEEDRDPLLEWLFGLRGKAGWEAAVRALDRVLWPYRFDHMPVEGDVVFSTPSGLASSNELGDAFNSVLVMALELLRLSTDRPSEELVYVIDDIDAHLHPRWQSRIIGDLHRAFPRVQLVATTHSPFVVASVEPHQVFRLERGAGRGGSEPLARNEKERGETASNLIRVSDRVQRGAAVTHVMDLAFGTPDLPGPRWVHLPPMPIRREVLRCVDDQLTRGAVVYVLPEMTHVKEIRNAFGEPVLPTADGQIGYVFFIDLEPGTAWGHACEYVFRMRDGKLARQRGIWPPAGLDRFIPIGRG